MPNTTKSGEANTQVESSNKSYGLGFKLNNIKARYHTHPKGTDRFNSYNDMKLSADWNVPVHAISPSGQTWQIHATKVGIGLYPYGIRLPEQREIFGTRIK